MNKSTYSGYGSNFGGAGVRRNTTLQPIAESRHLKDQQQYIGLAPLQKGQGKHKMVPKNQILYVPQMMHQISQTP